MESKVHAKMLIVHEEINTFVRRQHFCSNGRHNYIMKNWGHKSITFRCCRVHQTQTIPATMENLLFANIFTEMRNLGFFMFAEVSHLFKISRRTNWIRLERTHLMNADICTTFEIVFETSQWCSAWKKNFIHFRIWGEISNLTCWYDWSSASK
jgi:hypothetical protein